MSCKNISSLTVAEKAGRRSKGGRLSLQGYDGDHATTEHISCKDGYTVMRCKIFKHLDFW